MAELGEVLKQLFESGDGLSQVLEAAESLWQQNGQNHPACQDDASENQTDSTYDCLGPLIEALHSRKTESAGDAQGRSGNGASGSPISALPQLLLAFSGKSSYIDQKRLNLVSAIKPYMTAERADNVDRAIKMANMTVAAKMALGLKER